MAKITLFSQVIGKLGSADKRWGQIVVESRKMPIFAAWKRKYMNN